MRVRANAPSPLTPLAHTMQPHVPLRALANMRGDAIVVKTTDPATPAAASSRQRTR
ncbi:hypothetical protein K788_0007612 [Paraburkholderia caribensis MBA4]|uniref:Uncharacterized protein n=1 Tax=Paraburkholderia caribensis MBA4 TaxID=1323664 RepID=A0A0P0RK47_9BURK|nr:hypothetical protein K788_0007612 [Paraburkholderia caribensis MBA4]